jgi:prepilin-type N-terminal cleavage/methylation domain-containing protein
MSKRCDQYIEMCGQHKRGLAMSARSAKAERRGERGFTLIETTIGLVIMLIVALGSASLFSYAVYNNSGGHDRAQALAIAQQAFEGLRNARYTSTFTDTVLQATPANPTPQTVQREGRSYTYLLKVEDTTPTLKTITLTVTPVGVGRGLAREAVTIVTQRAQSDQP